MHTLYFSVVILIIMVFSNADKRALFDLLATDYIKALKIGQIANDQRKSLSHEVLNGVNTSTSWESILDFLNILSQKNNIFSKANLYFKNIYHKKRESNLIMKLKSQIQEFK